MVNNNKVTTFANAVKSLVDDKEDLSNKTTSLSSSSTNTQYPSAKAVYDALQNVGSDIDIVNEWEQTLSDEKVASEKLVKESIDSVLYETEEATLGTPTTSSNVSYTYNYNDTDLTLTIPTLNTCQFDLSDDFYTNVNKIGGFEIIFEIVFPQTGDAMFKLGDDDGGVALFQTYDSYRWRRYYGYCNYRKDIGNVDMIYYYDYDYDLGDMVNKENITISIQTKGNTSTIYFNDDSNIQFSIQYRSNYIQFSNNVSVNVYARIPNFPIKLSQFIDDTKSIEELEDGTDLNNLSSDKTYVGYNGDWTILSNCPVQNKRFVLINRNITPTNSYDSPNIQQILMTTNDGANTELWIRYHYQTGGYTGTWVKLATENGSGGSVTVDSTWISNSTNPVESQLIKTALDGKSDTSHTHNQYLTEHQSLANYVTTSDSRLSDARTPTAHTHTTSEISNLSIPNASTSTPSADVSGGAIGSSSNYAKADHQHPLSTAYATNGHNHDSSYIAKASTDTGFVKSNGNIVAFGTTSGTVSEGNHTHSNYLTEHQSLTNYVQKSSTSGLIKNDGTIMSGGTGSSNYAIGNHTHSSYVNPTIADNLTTNDSSQVLSAKQGKVLNDLIGQAISYINQ